MLHDECDCNAMHAEVVTASIRMCRSHGPRAPVPGQHSSASTGSLVVDVHLPAHLVPLETRLSACAGLVAPAAAPQSLSSSSSSSPASSAAAIASTAAPADSALSSMAQAHTLAMLPPVEDTVSSSSTAGRATTEEEWLSAGLSRALLPVLLLRRFPKAVISISVTVLAAPLSSASSARLGLAALLPPCVCAAALALADAGVDCTGLVGAAALALVPPTSPSSSGSVAPGLRRCLSGLPDQALCVTVVCARAAREESAAVADKEEEECVTLIEHAGAVPEDAGALLGVVNAAKAEAVEAAALMRKALRAALEQKPFYTLADDEHDDEDNEGA